MFANYLRIACLIGAASLMAGLAGRAAAQDANRETGVKVVDLGVIVNRLDKHTGDFKSSFDHAVEHSLMDHTRMDDNAKRVADDLHDNSSKLKDEYHDKKDKTNPKVREKVDRTLASGAEVNKIMMSHRFTDKLQGEWEALRSDLNMLAAAYNLAPLQ